MNELIGQAEEARKYKGTRTPNQWGRTGDRAKIGGEETVKGSGESFTNRKMEKSQGDN